jgi:CBS domain-containing protein
MKARDVMVSPVTTVSPTALVKDVAKLFLERGFSGAPVVDDTGRIVGIVSERDLMCRADIGTDRRRPWWLWLLTDQRTLAADYVKAHATKVADVMTRDVITVSPDTPLRDIATLLEKNAIKRVPIVENGQLVGLVSRANLVQAVATRGSKLDVPASDASIRDKLLAHLQAQPWAQTGLLNVTVADGVIDLWGITRSDTERQAVRVAAEAIPGARAVNDHLTVYDRLATV